jgi:3-methyladenine DNA glycosylase AlkD
MLIKIKKELRKYASVERKKTNEWFFKTGKGEYGEGDIFIGVRVPDIRKVAKRFCDTELNVLEKLLYSKIHEERLLALLILVAQSKQAVKQENRTVQKKIVNFYLKYQDQVNNWDLVDLSTHYILGQAILDGIKKESLLDEMAVSKNLWTRRKAIISTWIIIRQGKISTTLRLSRKLLGDKEDLMHKAVGWMLREAWKLGESNKKRSATENEKGQKAQEQIEQFLIKNYNKLPRTTLRYAIERMPEQKRKRFLRGEF